MDAKYEKIIDELMAEIRRLKRNIKFIADSVNEYSKDVTVSVDDM